MFTYKWIKGDLIYFTLELLHNSATHSIFFIRSFFFHSLEGEKSVLLFRRRKWEVGSRNSCTSVRRG